MLTWSLLLGILASVVLLTVGIVMYYRLSEGLPDVAVLRSQAAQFESVFVYDNSGRQLYEFNDPNQGRRTYVPLSQISPFVIIATIATEDKDYWTNPGFDLFGLLRAVYQNYTAGGIVSGASTITQQLARALLLSPEERAQRSNERKLREIILATRMGQEYSKDEILEIYLNEIYYGNLAYGIEAAAQTYFGKSASQLTFAEATFLAGLPQSPAVYDIFNPDTYDITISRHKSVVALTLEQADCAQNLGIRPAQHAAPLCINKSDAADAFITIQSHEFQRPSIDTQHPHWVTYIRTLLEAQYGAQEVYRSGFRVYTTLNSDLQNFAEETVKNHVSNYQAYNVSNGAVVVIEPQSGRILSMVGSDDFYDPVDGQINMALRPRQPGSSIKPFTFLLAFEHGWTPATLLWDVPTDFPDVPGGPAYQPRNYDGKFHGPVQVRNALGSSLNIPAVKALQFVGVYDNPNTTEPNDGLVGFMQKFGISTLTSDQYGLAITLGGAETTLLEMSTAYATLANGGKRVAPFAIARITDSSGNVLCQQAVSPEEFAERQAQGDITPLCESVPSNWGQQLITPQNAYLIANVLSDDDARWPIFAPGSPLETSMGAAVKTGTTNDVRDTWTMGYTPNLFVGVWTGNADFSPMNQSLGSSDTAAPIWNRIIENAFGILGSAPQPFVMPDGVQNVEVCQLTGAQVSDYCRDMVNPYSGIRGTRLAPFDINHPPVKPEDDLLAVVQVDKFSGKLPSDVCGSQYLEERRVARVSEEPVLKWLREDPLGQQFYLTLKFDQTTGNLPSEKCTETDPRPIVKLLYPGEDNVEISGEVDLYGLVDIRNGEFDSYMIEWGVTHDPQAWGLVKDRTPERHPEGSEPALLTTFDTRDKENGPVSFRLIVFDKQGHRAEMVRRVFIKNEGTPAPSDTPLPSETPAPSNTPLPSETPAPSNTPLSSETPAPSNTPPPTIALSSTPIAPTIASPSATSVPPTATSVPPSPTAIPTTVAPTATNLPAITELPLPPTDTPASP
jgi:penicillin-binding protein 1C